MFTYCIKKKIFSLEKKNECLIFFSMGRNKNPKRELILRVLKKYMRRASTRRNLYAFLAEKDKVTEAYVRLVASKPS